MFFNGGVNKMKNLKQKASAPKLSSKQLDDITRKMLRNISDPDVRNRVDVAEEQMEKKMQEAFSKRMLDNEKTKNQKDR